MPGLSHKPTPGVDGLLERLVRQGKDNTPRSVGGLARGATPMLVRDRMAASRRGQGQTSLLARASKIDQFDVADDTVDQFVLTYRPISMSWNVSLGRPLYDAVDYTITGRTLTVLDPAALFNGADAQGSPWNLHVQYDYLEGVPTAPPDPAEFLNMGSTGEQATGSPTIVMGDAPAAGSSVLLGYRSKFGGGVSSVSGLGATWTQIESMAFFELWLGTGCNGSGDTINLSSDHVNGLKVVEVSRGLTDTGADTSTAGNTTSISAVAAGAAGVAVAVIRQGSGITLTPDASEWEALPSTGPDDSTMWVRSIANGETIDAAAGGAWQAAMLAAVPYA